MVKITKIELDWKEVGGCIYTNDQTFTDAIIWWDGACSWNWNICKTSHSKGITAHIAKSTIKLGCTHVVVSLGMESRIVFPQRHIIDMFEHESIEYYILPSVDAVRIYNILHDAGALVAILLHSTC